MAIAGEPAPRLLYRPIPSALHLDRIGYTPTAGIVHTWREHGIPMRSAHMDRLPAAWPPIEPWSDLLDCAGAGA